MSKIDSIGVYRGIITEAALGVTKKGGYPQWVVRLLATEKYIETPDEKIHFKMKEAGWVDWSQYEDSAIAYLVLFKAKIEDKEPCVPGDNDLMSYELIQNAVGWDGSEFDSLNDASHVGKHVQFRVEENDYDGKTTFQVQSIDATDAPIQRELRKLDDDQVKGLNALLRGVNKPKVKPAKPGKPASSAAKPPATAAPPAGKKSGSTPPVARSEPDDETPVPTSVEPIDEALAVPDDVAAAREASRQVNVILAPEVEQEDAWNYVLSIKADNEDATIVDAWTAACGEIGGDRNDDTFTPTEWAKVRDVVIKDLALDVS